jgi:hypothetical protein
MAARKSHKQPADQEIAELNAKRELFCHYYTQNNETFGNATHAYAEAFGYTPRMRGSSRCRRGHDADRPYPQDKARPVECGERMRWLPHLIFVTLAILLCAAATAR